jgi:nicotinate-nucleotide pyrophosphorylase (carboxylating)
MNSSTYDLPWKSIEQLIALAYEEDLKLQGDVTVQAIFKDQKGHGTIRAKQSGRVSGLYLVSRILMVFNSDLSVTYHTNDGAWVNSGDKVITLEGFYRSILVVERTLLNFIGFLSGIASLTHKFVTILSNYGSTKLLDTRKTLPGFRELSKLAVLHGGGTNHRFGLYDMVMIKDNHADAAGGITPAVTAVRATHGTTYPIEIECRDLQQVKEALLLKPDRIMLDNMNPQDCKQAVSLRNLISKTTELEASGDMNEERIAFYATLELDFISIGKITHSAPGFNFSLTIEMIE